MALMLRKACQSILDKAGMDKFYADISSNTKDLTVYNICGKPFAPVHGVTFSRNDATKDEIAFATELFATWIKRNKTKLVHYLMARDQLAEQNEPVKEFTIRDWKCGLIVHQSSVYINDGRNRTNNYRVVFNLIKDGVTFNFDENHHLSGMHIQKSLADWSNHLKIPPNILREARAGANKMVTYYKHKKTVEDTQAELNSCCSS